MLEVLNVADSAVGDDAVRFITQVHFHSDAVLDKCFGVRWTV